MNNKRRLSFARFLLRHSRDPVTIFRLFLAARHGPRNRANPVPFHARLRFDRRNLDLYLRDGTTDTGTFAETFRDSIYDLALAHPPRAIVDVGANIGMTSIFFALRYPQAKIYSFEPIPGNYTLLNLNVEANRLTSIRTFPYGLMDKNEPLSFSTFQAGDRWSFSAVLNRGETTVGALCRKASDVWDELQLEEIDILKVDVEGAEFRIFHDLKPRLGRIRALIGELHLDAGNPEDILDMLRPTHRVSASNPGPGTTITFKAWRRDSDPGEVG